MNRHRTSRAFAINSLELLDDRIVPSSFGITPAVAAAEEALVTTKGGNQLGSIFQEFVNYNQAGAQGTFSSPEAGQINISGTAVEIDVRFSGGNLSTLTGDLQGLGMQVSATSPQLNIVEGYLPISQLPTVASNSNEVSLSPVYKPTNFGSGDPAQSLVALKGGNALGSVYQDFETYVQGGSKGTFTSSQASQLHISGNAVEIDVRFGSGDYNTLVNQLQEIGMDVTATSPQNGIVEGYLPIYELPTVASNSHETQLSPVYKATFR